MCTTPSYIAEDALGASRGSLADVECGKATLRTLEDEGVDFRQKYFKDVEYVFSRVQHHVHKKTKKGFVPLSNCAKKAKKKTSKSASCKADFPATTLCIDSPVLVCRGVAKKLSLKVSGRRNAIGKTLGRRKCEWRSGTTPAFAVLFRSNTHTLPNFRTPLIPETHDDATCPSKTCADWVRNHSSSKSISKLAQRAQREATGYYLSLIHI